ncbi:RNA-binding domain-containing protein [Lophium mytilinum]|uniref:RNA-binding domain-containing protein n=1 Tax=Lophium mytilinum TaxID=390894 RepID=A0A6A6R1S2_9PEZI|nr:RNA-binding domain-containing protein [Lophium mytilinum]
MFLLRRAAVRALSTPSTSFLSKPRSITTFTPASFRLRQQPSIVLTFQRRFASDDAEKSEEFAQTATEAPITETATEPAAETSETEPQSTLGSAKEYAQEKASDALGALGLQGAASAVAPPQSSQRSSYTNPLATPNKVLYVGNLFFEVTEDQLRRVFSRFGSVEDVRLVKDGKGLSRGFGYVTLGELDHATAAIENLNQQVFEGRRMNVQYHIQRERPVSTFNSARQPNPPTKTLFIGNMSFEMSDKDLNDLFRDIRNVMDVRVAIDRRTGQPRGFAHADFIDVKSAQAAKDILEGKEIYGRNLRVDFSASSSQKRQTTDE